MLILFLINKQGLKNGTFGHKEDQNLIAYPNNGLTYRADEAGPIQGPAMARSTFKKMCFVFLPKK